MRWLRIRPITTVFLSYLCGSVVLTQAAMAQERIAGEVLDRSSYGPSIVETLDEGVRRVGAIQPLPNERQRQPGEQGIWVIPPIDAIGKAASGSYYAINKWGDTRMGIGFPAPVDVYGAYFIGHAGVGAATPELHVIGYRDGQAVQQSACIEGLGPEPRWFPLDLRGVDRMEIVAAPVVNGGGWYGIDDLMYAPATDGANATVVVDFEELRYGQKLTGSGYANLTWETGSGDFSDAGVHSPRVPRTEEPSGAVDEPQASPQAATPPTLVRTFQGVLRGDAGSMSYPPDTIGAIGPAHYVETVNRNFAIYDKATGAQLKNILLGSFLPGSNGDPRVVFDHHSGRWIVLVTDFSATATIFLAVSTTSDPNGAWFKTSFKTNQGSDAGKWPDYPTLGVDQHGIYTSAYMVGGSATMTIWAIDKAPLIAPDPNLGKITAFRSLPFEGAIQPAYTYGTPPGEYFISYASSTAVRLRRVDRDPNNNWTLLELGNITVPSFSNPPNAPALGSTVPLNTVDRRLMMSMYRDGALWAAHTISVSGRAGCRWYEFDVASNPPTLVQSGDVADASLYYYFPALAVNSAGDVVMGFTGSNASQYAGCYYTGRRKTDPPGAMAPPVQYKPGTGPQNNIDSYGRNRWGDYSYTTLDPNDQTQFYTIQEYGHGNNIWGTYVGVLKYPGAFAKGDMNCDGVVNFGDISAFVLALGNPDEYKRQYPNCDINNGDINNDGKVDFGDINPFVELLGSV